jgi:predicted Rossmann fold flavoprotein
VGLRGAVFVKEAGRGHVIVVGAGAAGLMAAIFAATEGARVTLLESTRDGGRKILISGGGRCNVLPSDLDPGRYVTESSPNTLKKILLSWPLAEQRAFFENELGIPLVLEEETGKFFPESNRARDVRDRLVERARALGADLRFDAQVEHVSPLEGGRWAVRAGTLRVEGDSVIMATGGLSVPKTGSDGRGLGIVQELGHTIHELYPALTPLTADPPVHADLAGVSLPVEIRAAPPGGPFTSRGGFLFTHRGYSGPAVLDISHIAVCATESSEQPIRVLWGGKDEMEWGRILSDPRGDRVLPRVRRHLPDRLADRLVTESGIDGDRPLAQLRRRERLDLLAALASYTLPWTGDEGYRKAEVTGGGVALSEVRAATLESLTAPGLFLCGEILDAFGPIGGYNFAWAWATGRLAGRAASRRVPAGAERK